MNNTAEKEKAKAVLDEVIAEGHSGKWYAQNGGLDKEIYEADNRLQKTDIPRRAQVETLIDRIAKRKENGDKGEPAEGGPDVGIDAMRRDLKEIQETANRLVTIWIANRCLALNCPGDAGPLALALVDMAEEIESKISVVEKAIREKQQQAWKRQ